MVHNSGIMGHNSWNYGHNSRIIVFGNSTSRPGFIILELSFIILRITKNLPWQIQQMQKRWEASRPFIIYNWPCLSGWKCQKFHNHHNWTTKIYWNICGQSHGLKSGQRIKSLAALKLKDHKWNSIPVQHWLLKLRDGIEESQFGAGLNDIQEGKDWKKTKIAKLNSF